MITPLKYDLTTNPNSKEPLHDSLLTISQLKKRIIGRLQMFSMSHAMH